MLIYCGIDGTSNTDTSPDITACLMVEAMRQHGAAHVKRMTAKGFHQSKYFPGTQDKMTGASSGQIIEAAMKWILQTYGEAADTSKKLFLGGFSRGGAASVVIANRLAEKKIPVQEMYLFDAVDRSLWMDNNMTATIPKTVKRAFHAVRDPKSGSRRTFGNCGMSAANGNLVIAPFMTTHGGIGGWPNGAGQVKPGFGAEDFAYVAALGPAAGAAAAVTDPRRNNIHEDGEPWPSNIDVEQEKIGMGKAWSWMQGQAFTTLGVT